MPEQYLSYIYKCLLLKQIFWRVKGKHHWQPVVSFLAHDFQHIQKWSENGVRSEEAKPWYWSLSELRCEHSCAWPCTSLIWTQTLMRWVDSLAWPWTLDHHRHVYLVITGMWLSKVTTTGPALLTLLRHCGTVPWHRGGHCSCLLCCHSAFPAHLSLQSGLAAARSMLPGVTKDFLWSL